MLQVWCLVFRASSECVCVCVLSGAQCTTDAHPAIQPGRVLVLVWLRPRLKGYCGVCADRLFRVLNTTAPRRPAWRRPRWLRTGPDSGDDRRHFMELRRTQSLWLGKCRLRRATMKRSFIFLQILSIHDTLHVTEIFVMLKLRHNGLKKLVFFEIIKETGREKAKLGCL